MTELATGLDRAGQQHELRTDAVGRLSVSSAEGWDPITKSDSATIAGLYRAIRFDAAGAVKVSVLSRDGTTVHNLVRNVAAGEVWPAACVTKIWSTGTDSAVTVDGWS